MNSASIRSWLAPALVSLGLCALGCGSSTPPAGAAHDERAEHEHEHEHGEHAHMSGAIREMHDALAPLWHAEKSPDRESKTCEAVPTFEQRAGAIDKEVPEGARADEAGYHSSAQALVTAVGDLKAECAKPAGGRADFEAKFMAVHEAFHKVMERVH
jgi:hypothetical protein